MRFYLIAALVNLFYPNFWSAPHSFILSFSSLCFLCMVPAPFQLAFVLHVHLLFYSFIHLVSSSSSLCFAPNVCIHLFRFSLVWFLTWFCIARNTVTLPSWVLVVSFSLCSIVASLSATASAVIAIAGAYVHFSPTKPSHTRLVVF